MFGRVRASPLPVEFLEMERERLPTKMLKEDSLSVYEATILKLKQGSRKNLSLREDMMDAIIEYTNQSSAISDESISDLSSASQGAGSSETFSSAPQEENTYISDTDSSISTAKESRNMSIQYMFSRYNQSSYRLKEKGSQDDELMETDEGSLTDNSTCQCLKLAI